MPDTLLDTELRSNVRKFERTPGHDQIEERSTVRLNTKSVERTSQRRSKVRMFAAEQVRWNALHWYRTIELSNAFRD